MNKSRQKKSNVLLHSHLKQCLILVLAFLMVFQFSAPAYNLRAYAEDDTQTRLIEQLATDQAEMQEKTADDEMQANEKGEAQASDQDAESAEANAEDEHASDEPETSGKESNKTDASNSKVSDADVDEPKTGTDTKDTADAKDTADPDSEDTSEVTDTESSLPKSTEQEEPDSAAEYIASDKSDSPRAVLVQGEAALRKDAAAKALREEAGLTKKEASALAEEIFEAAESTKAANDIKSGDTKEEGDNPASDGSEIEYVIASWENPKTDESNALVTPPNDGKQSVRMKVSYGLSGEHGYKAGDVTIKIPANIFKDRNGNYIGKVVIPYAENPSTQGDYNWRREGDYYILTNNKDLIASAKGFVEFDITKIYPHDLVDMAVSDEFQALVQVVTHAGNTMSLHSNALTAQFDTDAKITKVTKKLYDEPAIVHLTNVPQGMESESGKYVKAIWYVTVLTKANTHYTLDYTDTIPAEESNAEGETYKGFILGATTEDGLTLEKEKAYKGYQTDKLITYKVETAYPIEQFQDDHTYTFHNNIKFTLTEVDDTSNTSDKSVSATGSWTYINIDYPDTSGHFMVFKNGNDGKGNNNNTNNTSGSTGKDLHMWLKGYQGWFGLYSTALNDMLDIYEEDGEDGIYELSYTVNSVGYTMPWMFNPDSYDEYGSDAPKQASSYTDPVTITTRDWGISFGRKSSKLAVKDEYNYVSVEFPSDPYIYKGYANKIGGDGSFAPQNPKDGVFKYTIDTKKENWPDIKLEILRDGEWEDWAIASWKGGSFEATLTNGETQTNRVIAFPEDTESFRTTVINDNTATEGNTITNAAIDYDMRVVVALKMKESLINRINSAFESSNMPKFNVYNRVNMTAVEEGNPEALVNLGTENYSNDGLQNRDGYDIISGYSIDTMTYPTKTSEFDPDTDWNRRNNSVTIHYSAKIEERSFINSRTTWQEAVNDGGLYCERHGVWRDLLPEGMMPDLSSIQLRSGDNLLDAYVIPNYNNSGRNLLVIEANLKPVAEKYNKDGIAYYMDVPRVSFDGVIDLDSVRDGYLDTPIHNVISFESDNDTIGTVEGYSGEPDDPYSSNNVATAGAFKTALEKNTMTNLDPERDTPSFVYAGTSTTIDLPGAAISGLEKRVMTNYDEIWSTGVYGKDPEANRRDVYAGGVYSYRLSYMPQELDTVVKDIRLYDSLENYYPAEGNDECDINAPRWKGTLRGVDTEFLESKGCAPVVYYYVGTDELDLTYGFVEDESLGNMDLSKDIWIKASDYTGELSAVTAVAIDASKDSEGNDFVLDPEEAIYVVINMNAPTVSDDGTVNDEFRNNIFDNDPHAYNNVYAMATSIDTVSGEEDPYQFIHNEYTKVGLKTYDLTIEKLWEDDIDRDGLRPGSVTINLLADGETVDSVTLPYAEDPNDKPRWFYTFNNLDYTDENGKIIHYSFEEAEVPEGYSTGIRIKDNTIIMTNKHIPEKITIQGQKTWAGDNKDVRPSSIIVTLYADGVFFTQQTVSVNSSGKWQYSFTGLNKYRDRGKEIVYTVKEDMTGAVASYECEYDGYDLINTYHPYGDLKVTKTATNTTPQSEDKTFVFGFEFTKTVTTDEGTDEDPVGTPFEYDILDESGDIIEGQSGTIATGQTLEIKGGQTIHVKEIGEYINYRVYEEETPGFELITSSNSNDVTGVIQPNDTQNVEFINKYSTDGGIEFNATKTLYGHELQRYKFHYGIYELTRDENGKITDTALKKTGYNDEPEETITNDDGQTVSATAPVRIGRINYTQEDNGKTFYYKMVEYKGKNEHEDAAATGNVIDGYVYDETVYYATVTVTDNGDGTMDTAVVYTDEDGTPLEGGDDPDFVPLFENSYQAEGDVDFKVWKDLPGRKLHDEEFEFEMLDSEGYPLTIDPDTGKAVRITDPENQTPIRTKNDETGTAAFDRIRFDQTDIGKSYYFAFREVIPEEPDTTVTYDMNVYGYKVTITDNNDGTLSCSMLKAKPLDEEGNQAKQDESSNVSIANWTEENAGLPVFENKLKPGGFSVTKLIDNPDEAPNQQFHFKVKLIGDDIPDTLEYDLSQVGQGEEPGEPEPDPDEPQPGNKQAVSDDEANVEDNADEKGAANTEESYEEADEEKIVTEKYADNEAPAENSEPGAISHTLNGSNIGAGIIGKLLSHFTDKAYGAEGDEPDPNEERSTEGTAYAVLTADGDLILFRSYDSYTHKAEGTFTDIFDNTYTGRVFSAIETTSATSTSNSRWYDYRADVKSFSVADGQLIKPISCAYWFQDCTKMTKFSCAGLDTSGVSYMQQMFYNCTGLTSLDLSGLNTGNVTNMTSMFRGLKLTSLDLSMFNTAKVTTMYNMFGNCSSLRSINVSSFNTSRVSSMSYMFDGCNSLGSLDLTNFNTANVTTMDNMFRNDRTLNSITFDETKFVTSKVTVMNGMFQSCSNLKTLNLSSFKTPKVTNMGQMFQSCSSLESLDLSSFYDYPNSTTALDTMINMFNGCSKLGTLNLTGFNTSVVTNMNQTFKGCSSLTTLDLSSFKTPKVTTMASMFESCSSLTSLDLSSFYDSPEHTSALTTMDSMFEACKKLTTVNFENFKTPKVTTMGQMFYNCTGLKSVDMSSFYDGPTSETALKNLMQTFRNCTSLESVNFDNFSTGKLEATREMFYNCGKLRSVDLSSFNTSNVNTMVCMFCLCSSLKSLDLKNFETPKVTATGSIEGFDRIFSGCSSLEKLDISNFSVTSTVYCNQFFNGCSVLKEVKLGEKFRFNSGGNLPKPPTNSTYTGKWIMETEDYGPYTPAQVAAAFNGTSNPVISTSALAGTWIWEKKSSQYTILFAAPEEATGSMPKVKAESAEPFEIPENKFYWFKHAFSHWTDGRSRAIYEDKGTIPANTYAGNDRVTLTAVFTDLDTTVTLEDGQFDLYLYGNEKATFTDIPAGTAYQIWEETLDGWVLVKQENISGNIEPLTESEAKFTNRYQPGTVTAQFSGTKKLDNKAAEAGSFQFELTEKNNEGGTVTIINDEGEYEEKTLPLSATVLDGGFIQFPVIIYTKDDLGEHEYITTEVDPNMDTIDYDIHEERITVTITENEDGTLSSTVEYDEDGISFVNKTRPGVLKINKVGENVTKQNADDEFTFKVTLYNEDGQSIGGDEGIYWYTLDSDGNVIGNDDGGKNILEKASAKAAEVWDDVKTWASDAWDDVREAFTVENAYGAEGDPNEGRSTEGTAYAVLTNEGDLIFFRSNETYSNNMTGDFVDIFGNTYSGRVFSGVETRNGSTASANCAWFSYLRSINKVYVADGQLIKPKNMCYWFNNCSNMTYFSGDGFDTSNVWTFVYLFYNCTSLKGELDIRTFKTTAASQMEHMFANCRGITKIIIDKTKFKTPKARGFIAMFENCSSLQTLDLSCITSTPELRDCNDMFNGCTNLKELKAPRFISTNFRYTNGVFRNCGSLEFLDLTGTNTTNMSSMANWFTASNQLKKVILGENFRFNNTSTGLLPTPPSNNLYTGKWIKETEDYGPYTSAEVAAAFNGTSDPVISTEFLAGTWVWQVRSDRCLVQFDANGGYTGQSDIIATSATQSITMPDSDNTFYLHYILTGWNTEKDGSGTAYEAGSTYDNVVRLGRTVILYAQWEATNLREYRVEHYQQNTDLETYTLADSETLMADYGTSVTPEVKSYKNFIIPEAQTVTIAEDDSTVVKYYYDRLQYKINFDGNGATSGVMYPIDMIGGISKKLPKNTYSKVGSLFTGWSDGRRAMYSDQQQVVDLSEDGSDVTLYAQWMDNPNEPLTPTNGEIYVHCKAGETIVIPDLPAGTKYTIEEVNMPDGWTNTGYAGEVGTIIANGVSEATFTNTYNAAGEIQIEATKMFDEGTLTADQFEFGLYDRRDNLIATGQNDENGHIVFDTITYDISDIGEHNYVIREIIPDNSDPTIVYDTHEEDVTVMVVDGGDGILDVSANYDKDGAVFTNELKPGTLVINKNVTSGSPQNNDFPFKIELFDQDGNEDTELTFTWEMRRSLLGRPEASGESHSGDELTITSGYLLVASGIPAGYTYKVTELDKIGWVLIYKENDEGTIVSNESVEATFLNEYYVEGEAIFEADKQLVNKNLEEGMFHFGIFDEDGNLVTSGTNDADGHITFDPIKYYLADSGNTYNYTMSEIEEDIEGVTYATNSYDLFVTVEDNGDGTMTVLKGPAYKIILFENVYDAKGNITFKGTKTITGREMNENDVFSFVMTEEGTGNEWRFTNDSTTGAINYPKIEYTYKDIGKHTYTINETSVEGDGIKPDETVYTVVVDVSDNGDGTLNIVQTGGTNWNALNFVNTYDANGDITFTGSKVLVGRDLREDESYEFTLYDENRVKISSTTSGLNGAFAFNTLHYTLEKDKGKTYIYYVKETSEGGAGVTIDDTEYKITVSIVDKGNGELGITAVVDKEGVDYKHLVFTNTYEATGSVTFKGEKTLDGRALTANDKFDFVVLEGDTEVASGQSDQNGKITFTPINYMLADVKTHTYTVKETSTDGNGITVDTNTYTVIIKVSDNGDGTLNIEKLDGSDDYNNLDFVNDYDAVGSVIFEGDVTLEGREMTDDDEFTFTCTDEDGNVREMTQNEDGTISYPSFDYTLDDVGEHTYIVTQTSEDGNGVTIDHTVYVVTVIVEDNGDGTLKITVVGADPLNLDFVNVYKATGSIQIEARKELLGRVLREDEFEFAVYKDGKLISKASNDNDGKIVFDKMDYDNDDRGKTYEYTVKELPGDVPGVTYDEREFKVKVSITDNLDGTLNVEMETDEDLVFVNPYNAEGTLELSGAKTIDGREMTRKDIFEFTVSEDGEVIQTAENDEDGVIGFENIEYTLDDVGTHTYTVKETAGDEENMTYDDTEYTVEVEVSDNGDGTLSIEVAEGSDDPKELDFVNEYKPEKPIDPDPDPDPDHDPKTGDTTNIVPYACGLGAGMIALIIVLFRRKKKDK